MASLFKKRDSKTGKLLSCWYANWRNGGKVKMRSTMVPIKGEVVSGFKETPSQARGRAQIIADGYEAADKEGIHSLKVKATISTLANEDVSPVPSVERFLTDYIASREGQLSPGTIVNSKTAIKLFLEHLDRRASSPINSIKRSDVKDFVNEQVKHVRKRTVQKYLTALSPAFMAALDSELIDKNPFFRIKVPDIQIFDNTEKEAFSLDEITQMLSKLPSEWKSMIIFCLYTGGQRLGDIATLTWEQIDIDHLVITIKTGKTGRHLRVPIVAPLSKHISELNPIGKYVHPSAAEKYNRNGSAYLSYQFRKELEYAGIIPVTEATQGSRVRSISPKSFHCLRATAATLLHMSGVNAELAREVVGHDSKKAHQLYIRPDDEQRRTALEKLAKAMNHLHSEMAMPHSD